MLNSKTENELVKEFVNFLIKQGYPSKQICQEKCIVSKTAKVYGRLDIAIVVGDKIIEAFEFKKYAKNKTHRINDFLGQLSLYQEHIDSSVLSNDIHLTTYDKGEWWVYSRWNDTWLLAKDILSFDRVASEFYIKAYEQAKDTATPIEKPNFKWIRITCWSVSIVALLYIIVYRRR